MSRAYRGIAEIEVPIEPIQPELVAKIREKLGRAYRGWDGRRERGAGREEQGAEGGTLNVEG